MAKLVNRAKMGVSGTPGTGSVTLGSASSSFQSFSAAGVVDTDIIDVLFEDGTAWELSSCVYTASGTSLARTLVESSTGSLISLSSSATAAVVPRKESYGMVLLATLTASNSATLDFTGLSKAFDQYVIVFEDLLPATSGVKFKIRFSTNAGSSWITTGYQNPGITTDGIVLLDASGASDFTLGNTATDFSDGLSGSALLGNVNSAKTKKVCGTLMEGATPGYTPGVALFGGNYGAATTVINGIRFLYSSGNIASGVIKIYGLRK